VSTHTGIPDISIPIYNIKSGPLELPVSLSYHASGLKVQEQASWVGAGWTLNAGGVITRTVMGAPDDKGLQAAYTTKGHFSDYGYNNYVFSPGPTMCSSLPTVCPQGRSGMPANNNAPQDSYIQTGIFDSEPDLYFFNFNGYSGKFYFNDDRTPVMVPEQDLKITPIYPGNDWRGITGFIITTPDGVQYYFGQNPNTDGNIDAVEITYNVTTQNQYTGQGATSAWYLNKIASADGQFTINLIYQAESYSYYTLSMYPIPGTPNPNWYAYNHEYDLDKNFINGVRLSKIIFANGEVDLISGNLRQDLSLGLGPFPNYTYTGLGDLANSDATLGGRTLGAISIQTKDICKKYSFYYGYFYDNSPLTGDLLTISFPSFNITSDQYRLRLDSIQESSCDAGIKIPQYKFSYFGGTVPRKLSFGIDHWGFYNGVTINKGLIPSYTIAPQNGLPGVVTNVSGADRDTHWPNSLGGALQQITFPTGGFQQFDYESNDLYTATPIYAKTLVGSFSAGYSGPSNLTVTGTFTTDGSSNTYELDLSSNQPSSQTGGDFQLNGGSAGNYSVGAGQSATYYFTLTPSTTYNYTLYDNNNGGQISGYGVTANLYELVPTTVNANSQVGGIRIKTVTNNDGFTSNNIVTSYRYTFNNVASGQSSGILYSRPVYIQGIRNDVLAAVNGASCSPLGCLTCFGTNVSYYQSPSSIRPMSTTQGNHIGYGEVYVSQTGNGYTEYRYYGPNGAIPHVWDPPIPDVCVRALSTFCDPNLPNSPAPPIPFDPMKGELAYQAHFKANNQLLKSNTYIPLYSFDSLITPGIISRFFVTGYVDASSQVDPLKLDPLNLTASNNKIPIGVNSFTEYMLQSAKKVQDSVITLTYDPTSGSYITETNTTFYGSNYHHQPTLVRTFSSKGEPLVTNLKYTADFRISNYTVADQLGTYYTNLNGDNTYVGNALAGVTNPSDPNYYWQRLNIYMNYRYMKAIDRQTYLNYRLQNLTGPGNVYTTSHNAAKAAADGELKPILELQDEFKNPVIEQSRMRNGNLVHSEFTHYDYVANPSNFVYPAKTQMINLQGPSNTFTAAAVNGNSLTKDSRYGDEVVYVYNAGNPQQATAHDGVTASYIWDYLNTAPIAKVTNATADQVAYTSFEADGSGSWTIGSPSRVTTSSLTGTSCYSLNNDISRSGLNSTSTYVVSYWTTNGTPFTIAGTLPNYPAQGRTCNINGVNWTYYEHKVTGQGTVQFTGAGLIDELRLYPANAQMMSYTYLPLVGMSSSSDASGKVVYYEYDGLGRLLRARDMDKNIVKQFDYQYQVPNK